MTVHVRSFNVGVANTYDIKATESRTTAAASGAVVQGTNDQAEGTEKVAWLLLLTRCFSA